MIMPIGYFLEGQGQSCRICNNYDWGIRSSFLEVTRAEGICKRYQTFPQTEGFSDVRRKKRMPVFNSGDGVEVDIAEIKARLKSPESMFTKLGKSVEEEAYDKGHTCQSTFILKSRDDTLSFSMRCRKGVILQENNGFASITQTLFDDPADMIEATANTDEPALSKSEGKNETPGMKKLLSNATRFLMPSVSTQQRTCIHLLAHKKFQLK